MIIFENDTFQVLEVNESAISCYGYSRKDFLELSTRQLRIESELDAFDKLSPAFMSNESVYAETQHCTKSGEVIDVDIISYVITYRNKVCRLAHIHNVSSKVRQDKNLQILLSIGQSISGDLDLQSIIQKVTDASTTLCGAQFGAFFYNSINDDGEEMMLFTLSGAPREEFEKFGMPRNTAIFHPTLANAEVVRISDIKQDPRYGHSSPHFGLPKGHPPIASYMAIPVISQSKNVIGSLFFGHQTAGMFTEEDERMVLAVSTQAAVALDNAYLFQGMVKANREKENHVASLQQANNHLEELAGSLKLALESAEMGIWKADASDNVPVLSEEARQIYGIPEGLSLNSDEIFKIIDVDYRENTVQLIKQAIETNTKFEVEYVVNPFDGSSSKWVKSTGKAFYDHQGSPIYILGTITDVSDQKNREDVLKYRKALLEAQNEAIPDAILIVDTKGKMLSFNHHFVTLWRIPKEIVELKDDSLALQFAMTQLADPQGFIDRVNYCYANPTQITQEEVLFKDGRVIERYGTHVVGEDGTLYGWAWYFRDVTKQQELQKQKDEFISTVSHELKTPVTSIKAYAQLLNKSFINTENSAGSNFLERMNIQIHRLELLIKDLLDVTRVDAGKLELKEDQFDMQQLLAELVQDLQLITPSHSLNLKENERATIKSDRGRIVQVITNLITNAVKYSPNSDHVNICSKTTNEFLILSVVDDGIGIAEDQKKYLFDRFHQIERANVGTGYNLGLGLYISKEIITRLGGDIWVESKFGEGSTFSFSLPLKRKL